MLTDASCPVCSGRAGVTWPALVSPFVAEYVLDAALPAPCSFLECASCGLRYYDHRYTEAETGRLYGDYRGPTYLACRHRHEPWYTEAYNNAIGWDPALLQARRKCLSGFLARAGRPGPFGSVLDYGGDSGQLIPPGLAAEAFVHDLSDAPAAPGVVKVEGDAGLLPEGYDLVLLAHVLEHAPDPLALLGKVARLLRPAGGLLYVEVPLERPWMGLLGRGRLSRAWLDMARRRPAFLRLLDFYSTAFRVKLGFLPPLGFMKVHEHVNHFSSASVARALERSGLTILHLEQRRSRDWAGLSDVVAALATLPD